MWVLPMGTPVAAYHGETGIKGMVATVTIDDITLENKDLGHWNENTKYCIFDVFEHRICRLSEDYKGRENNIIVIMAQRDYWVKIG